MYKLHQELKGLKTDKQKLEVRILELVNNYYYM